MECKFFFFFSQFVLILFFVYSPVWLCAQCFVCYDNEEIEIRLLDVIQRKIMSYTLQDLRCERCKQIKRENIAEFCPCGGSFVNLISTDEIKRILDTFMQVADDHKMELLKENVCWILKLSFNVK